MNPSDMEREFLMEMKETLTYVALEFDNEMKKASTTCDIDEVYELPDGRIVLIKNERFRCAEVFFQPKLADLDSLGIHEILNNSILHSDVGIRKDLYDNILLSGGSTKFPGFEDRLTKELLPLFPKETNFKVHAPIDREISSWRGGSIMGGLSSYRSNFISRNEFEEFGTSIVTKKCLHL